MPRFEPKPGDTFSLNGDTYQIMGHPNAPSFPYAQEGRKAVVYQVTDKENKLLALKVFKHSYRVPSLVKTCEILKPLIRRGLEVCDRVCIDSNIAPKLIHQYPELEYSILMPWIEGSTWFELILSNTPISKRNALFAARNLAQIVADLEKNGFAHCDIAGSNIIVNPKTGYISLVDVEDMFGPGLSRPNACPRGTAGYRHPKVSAYTEGQWRLEGDRFSTSIILGEILCWHDESFRMIATQEHFFDDQELQDQNSPRYKALQKAISNASLELLKYFNLAWEANDLSDCPEINTWYSILEEMTIGVWKPIVAPPVSLPIGKGIETANQHSGTTASNLLTLARPQIYPANYVRVDQKYILRWLSIPGADHYELQCVESELGVREDRFGTIYNGSLPYFEITQNRFGAYYYRARALSDTRTSQWSAIEVVFVYPHSKPAKTRIYPISNALGDRSFTIKWSPVENAQWYEVQEITGNWPIKKSRLLYFNGSSRIKDTQILIVSRKTGYYSYRVRAYNFCGFGDFSNSITITVKPTLTPSAPQIVKINNPTYNSDFSISWKVVPGAAGYILFESSYPGVDDARRIYQGKENKFMITGKEPGNYYYSITAHDGNGLYDSQMISGWVSTKVELQVPVWHMPKHFYDVQSDEHEGNAEFQLVWNPVRWAESYNLAWEDDLETQHIELMPTNSCLVRRPEGRYMFKVRAVGTNNIPSVWSPPIYLVLRYIEGTGYEIIVEGITQ